MRWLARAAVAVAVAAGVVAVRRARAGARRGRWPARPRRQPAPRWHTVTVNRTQEQVAPQGRLPDPLARLAGAVEVRLRPAPADRGTEVAARRDGGGALRRALRETRQLVETGEVLRAHEPATARRTLRNWPVRFAVRHGREGGRL